jgi:hypothetical protein
MNSTYGCRWHSLVHGYITNRIRIITVRTIHKGQIVIWVHRLFQRKRLIVQNIDTSSEIFSSARSIWMALQACVAQGVLFSIFMSLSWGHAAGFLGRKVIPSAIASDLHTKRQSTHLELTFLLFLCCPVTAEVLWFSGLLWQELRHLS